MGVGAQDETFLETHFLKNLARTGILNFAVEAGQNVISDNIWRPFLKISLDHPSDVLNKDWHF